MAFTINIGGSQINLILILKKKLINKNKYVINLANITYANEDPCHLAFLSIYKINRSADNNRKFLKFFNSLAECL